MTTVHANSTRDALARLENMVLMAGMDLPHRAIREQISGALNIIIQLERMRDGSRKVVAITEVQGMEGDVIVMQDIFAFHEGGMDQDEKRLGEIRPTGVRPRFDRRLELAGFELPAKMFMRGVPLSSWHKSEKRG